MIPQMAIPEHVYLNAFRQYAFGLATKWLEINAESTPVSYVLDRIDTRASSNYRATYLLYLLPFADAKFASVIPLEKQRAMQKVLFNLLLNDVPYNDFMLKRFCEILLGAANRSELFFERLPEDYKDLQKLLWTFIQQFRKDVATQYGHVSI